MLRSPPPGERGESTTPVTQELMEDIEDRIRSDLLEQDPEEIEQILNSEEKRFLLYVERGDVASVQHILKKGLKDNAKKAGTFNINCLDPLGRSALNIGIENENLEMVTLLLDQGIEPGDALLHAISEEYVEGVEILLSHEERIHVPGEAYSWQMIKDERSTFTPDITPLIMAAHHNHYEILKLLLDRGATLPMPHDIKCACDECLVASADDSLRHSLARINSYKALSSPSLICLSSTNPFDTAFKLSDDLAKLASLENEFSSDYNALTTQVQTFTNNLVDETRTSTELEIILNYDPEGDPYKQGEVMHFALLKEAVDCSQKKFVAHANVQQLLARCWYDGMPGFKRRQPIDQLMEVFKIGAMFPVYCLAFLAAPQSKYGASLKKPFIKFIVHSASYCFFLTLLVIVSLRVETHMIEFFGNEWMIKRLRRQERESRGGWPSFTELLIVVYIFGIIFKELKTLWEEGILDYIKDLWNFIDFGANFFYMNWIFLRLTAFFLTQRSLWRGIDPYYPREMWPPFDPLLISEAMFCAGNIMSFMKLIHMFSINHHMGPLQIALGRMVVDIIKFFFIYSLVLFAFGCGLNNLLWYYADIDKTKCYSGPDGTLNIKQGRSCAIWRRFSNLFETSQSLFWASFGLVELNNFDLTGIKGFTRFWSMLMYGSYNVINVIVLLNLLIAMMSNSYTVILEDCDSEWKFARSKLWMSYFEEGDEVPPPFNLLPNFHAFIKDKKVTRASVRHKKDNLRDTQYQGVTRNLVRRYITCEQRKLDETDITEDDINEVKQDIRSFKYEILNMLKINGWTTGDKHHKDNSAIGRKQQMKERRLMKGFNIGIVEGVDSMEALACLLLQVRGVKKAQNDWNKQVRKTVRRRDPIGSSTMNIRRQHLRQNARSGKAWSQVKFYQRRGVFTGGEINNRMLEEIKLRNEAKRVAESKIKGWRRLQRIHERGNLMRRASRKSLKSVPESTSIPQEPSPAVSKPVDSPKPAAPIVHESKQSCSNVGETSKPSKQDGPSKAKDSPKSSGSLSSSTIVDESKPSTSKATETVKPSVSEETNGKNSSESKVPKQTSSQASKIPEQASSQAPKIPDKPSSPKVQTVVGASSLESEKPKSPSKKEAKTAETSKTPTSKAEDSPKRSTPKADDTPKPSAPQKTVTPKPPAPKPSEPTKTEDSPKLSTPKAEDTPKPSASQKTVTPKPPAPKPSEPTKTEDSPKLSTSKAEDIPKPSSSSQETTTSKPPAPKTSELVKPPTPKPSESPKPSPIKPKPEEPGVSGISAITKQKRTGWL